MFIKVSITEEMLDEAEAFVERYSTEGRLPTAISMVAAAKVWPKMKLCNSSGGIDVKIKNYIYEIRSEFLKTTPPQPWFDVSVQKKRKDIKRYLFTMVSEDYETCWIVGRISTSKFFDISKRHYKGKKKMLGCGKSITCGRDSWDTRVHNLTLFKLDFIKKVNSRLWKNQK